MEEKMNNYTELKLELTDNEWQFEYTDHDRNIVRAIVYDDKGYFYFVRADRDDDFGRAKVIETAGGGVEDGEDLTEAIKRELLEELGAEVEVICKLGVVSDYYNLIHRHNINNYYLCRVISLGDNHLTEDEAKLFHLSTMKLTYGEAAREYENNKNSMLGRLIYNREEPILKRAKELLDKRNDAKTNYEIRPMKPTDKPTILDMMRRFYNSPAVYTNGSEQIYNDDIDNCLNDSPYLEGYVFVGGEIIMGYAMLAKSFSTEFGKPCIWIEDLYIEEKFRNKGIGSRFFEFIENKYRGAIFRLEVEEDNKIATYVYKKAGFDTLPYIEMKKL